MIVTAFAKKMLNAGHEGLGAGTRLNPPSGRTNASPSRDCHGPPVSWLAKFSRISIECAVLGDRRLANAHDRRDAGVRRLRYELSSVLANLHQKNPLCFLLQSQAHSVVITHANTHKLLHYQPLTTRKSPRKTEGYLES